jgi:hypothetical protein
LILKVRVDLTVEQRTGDWKISQASYCGVIFPLVSNCPAR